MPQDGKLISDINKVARLPAVQRLSVTTVFFSLHTYLVCLGLGAVGEGGARKRRGFAERADSSGEAGAVGSAL